MRLWQKIFLISLICIFIAVEGTAVAVSWTDFHSTIQREESQAVTMHTDLVNGMVGQILYERLSQDKVLLPPNEVLEIVEKRIISHQSSNRQMAVFPLQKGKSTIADTSGRFELLTRQTNFRREVLRRGKDECLTLITEDKGNIYCLTGSLAGMEGQTYEVYTTMDFTDLYQARQKQLHLIGNLSLGFAITISAILMLFVYLLLRPLREINHSLQKLAGGNYNTRLEEKGNQEFQILAQNVNTMAIATEEHVNRLRLIAEERKQFIDSFAHEMKTPLTSIMGFADILRVKRSVSDAQRQEYADIIVKEANRLKNLSGKILELATTEGTQLEFEITSAKKMIDELKVAVRPLFHQKHIKLRIHCEDVTVCVDRELFKSLLYNLIDNAVKASKEQGEIRLRCIQQSEHIVFSVEDDGIGMTKEQLKHVEEPFYMADKSRSRKAGGAGLGLALCAEIVKRHQASLTFKSSPGIGTTVQVRIQGGENP